MSDLVAKALLHQGRYVDLYATFRLIELGADLEYRGLGKSELQRHTDLLSRLGVARKGVVLEPDQWTLGMLKQLQSGVVAVDMRKGLVVHKSGNTIDCETHRFSLLDGTPAKFPEPPKLTGFAAWAPERQEAVTALIDRWKERFGYPDAKHTPKRQKTVNARLADYTVAQLEQALDTAEKDPWWRGRAPNNDVPRDSIEVLLASVERVDRFLAKARSGYKGAPDRRRLDLAMKPGGPTKVITF